MTLHKFWLRRLHAYHDGELGDFARWRIEAKLRRSAALRRELEELRSFRRRLRRADAAGPSDASIDLWSAIQPELARIDSEFPGSRTRQGMRSLWTRLRGEFDVPLAWGPLASVIALAIVLLFSLQFFDYGRPPIEGRASTSPSVVQGKTLRYLKTDGRPFVVSEERNGVTIIWLMDFPVGT